MSGPDLSFLDEIWRPAAGKGRKDKGGAAVAAAMVSTAQRAANRAKPDATARSAAAKQRLERITRFAPEVMVKVSGRQRGGAHTAAHLEYIGRHGKLDVETSDGRTIENVTELRELAREWTEDEEAVSRRREPLTSVSMVFSMPPGTNPDGVYQSVRAFARVELEPFPHAMALHLDADHPHVHLTIAARGEGGMRFNPRKADLAMWRESFARELRARGIDAEATPRRARGIVQKAERTSVRKTRERGSADSPLPQVVQGGRAAAVAMAQENPPAPRPWEVQTVVRQAEVRRGYAKAAELLEQSSAPEDRTLARQTRAFVAAMPRPLVRDREEAQALVNADRGRHLSESPAGPDGRDRASRSSPGHIEKDRER
ncbi:relaxase/mobilization nuclease domain-containing protein [Sphingomonas sp. PAMC 26605]|uniref:relaxase/mobilization nuclease domain-containing protein n=1 Tax=Sphingomonas sp. PAMC 26605 TaxID=1112214 RepID=UPI00026CB9B0|nr:type IV secretory pathway VirD2 protein [Sphingomonas sp. PAMC 26605]